MNLVCVDNLDQLPTAHIHRVINDLHSMVSSLPNSNCPVLVPLRPSSLNVNGFIREIPYIYHYGPNPFEVMEFRLQKYVLAKSVDELTAPSSTTGGGTRFPFSKDSTEEERRAFIISSYLLAWIARTCYRGTSATKPTFHSDHDFLNFLDISWGTRRNLGETFNAIVGHCCRYALEQEKKYYYNMYLENPGILIDAINQLKNRDSKRRSKIRYNSLLPMMFCGAQPVRLINLYAPVEVGPNRGWPSLVKLRILSLLENSKRLRIRDVVKHMGGYGIPRPLVISTLNSLHKKYRILLWFSNNRRLSNSDKDLDEHVVISEHGLGYLNHVLGDFEYVWLCAAEIMNLKPAEINFPDKLAAYNRLLNRLGNAEWKQQTFYRHSTSINADSRGSTGLGSCYTLRIVYSSLERALVSAKFALKASYPSPYQDNLSALIKDICDLILTCHRRYDMCFDLSGIYIRYKNLVETCSESLTALVKKGVLDDDGQETAKRVLMEFDAIRNQVLITVQQPTPVVVNDSMIRMIIGNVARSGSTFLKEFIEKLDNEAVYSRYSKHFILKRGEFQKYMSERLPIVNEVRDSVSEMIRDLDLLMESGDKIAANHPKALSWFEEERTWLNSVRICISKNNYSINDLSDRVDMDEKKSKCNLLISHFGDIRQRLAIDQDRSFNTGWHEGNIQ